MNNHTHEDIDSANIHNWKLPRHTFKVLIYITLYSMMFGHLYLMLANMTRYSQFVSHLKDIGEPASLADFNITHIPDNQNGVKYLLEAIEQPFIDPDNYSELYDLHAKYIEFDPFDSIDDLSLKQIIDIPEMREIVRGWLEANKPTLELIKQSVKLKNDFKVNYADKVNWDKDIRIYDIRYLFDLMKYRVLLAIADNDKLEALQSFMILTEFSQLWAHEMTWEFYMFIEYTHEYAIELLYHIVNELELTSDELDFLYSCYAKTFETQDIMRLLSEERALYLDYIYYINNNENCDLYFVDHILYDFPPPMHFLAGRENLVQDVLLKVIDYQTKLIDLAGKPYLEIRDELNRMIKRTQGKVPIWDNVLDMCGIRLLRGYYDEIALHRIIHTTLAIKKFELMFDRIPYGLYELIGVGLINTMPTSPFTGQELIYEITDGTYRLFCPGSNGALFKYTCDCIANDFETAPLEDIEWDYSEEDEDE